jgi:hypothetical protein
MLVLAMRMTIEFDDDTASAVEHLRREAGLGESEAVNELIRRGLVVTSQRPRFRQRTHRLGLRIDVSNIADALDTLEGPGRR